MRVPDMVQLYTARASTAARSSGVSRQFAVAALPRTCSGFVAPAMTDATAGCASSHANASSNSVCFLLSAK